MKRTTSLCLISLLLLTVFLLPAGSGSAQADSASVVINTINQLRAQRGLAALQVDPALMSIAQQHSNYQASLGTWTHVGPDGSRPRDRAAAAGFGGGAQIYVSENVAYGTNMSIMDTINGPWNDPEHFNTMFNPNYQYIGAGVAYSGDLVFYTVDTGYWIGDPNTNPSNPEAATETPSASLQPTPVPVVPSTPAPDGSIAHTVREGQTLWTIAAVYGMPIEEIIEINQLDENPILIPGDNLAIQPSSTPTITPIGLPSPTLPVRFTHTPSPVGNKQEMIPVTVVSTPDLNPEPEAPQPRFQNTQKRPTAVIIGLVVAGGTLIFTLISSLQKRDSDE